MKTISLSKLTPKAAGCLLGSLLLPSIYAGQLDAIAQNAVLIDPQSVLTVAEPGLPLPTSVLINKKQYKVVSTSENPFFTHTLLFLETPVTDVDSITRLRTNPQAYLGKTMDVYTFGQQETPHYQNTIDFSLKKRLGVRNVNPREYNVNTFSSPITYVQMSDSEISHKKKQGLEEKGLLLVPNDIQLGAGYFIKNNQKQFQLIGLHTLVKSPDSSAGVYLAKFAHNVEANTYMDSAIIQNVLGMPSSTPSITPFLPMPSVPGYAPSPVIPTPHSSHAKVDRIRQDLAMGSLFGLACGDALGITTEQARGFTPKKRDKWLKNMVGRGGSYKAGDWSDDTSLALAIATSLIDNKGFDPKNIKDRFLDWHEHGTYDSQGIASHGSGGNTRNELDYYKKHPNHLYATKPANNIGNGAIMRQCPVNIFYYKDLSESMKAAVKQAKLTHASPAAHEASAVLTYVIHRALNYDPQKDTKLKPGEDVVQARKNYALNLINYLKRRSPILTELNNLGKKEDRIDQRYVLSLVGKEGSNKTWYGIKKRGEFIKTLQANYNRYQEKKSKEIPGAMQFSFAARSARDSLAIALWSVQHTKSIEDAIIMAANMGGDSDTIGAITGQIAGAIYGYNAIPQRWKAALSKTYDIPKIAKQLYRIAEQTAGTQSE